MESCKNPKFIFWYSGIEQKKEGIAIGFQKSSKQVMTGPKYSVMWHFSVFVH